MLKTQHILAAQAMEADHSADGRKWRFATPRAQRRLVEDGTDERLAAAVAAANQALHQFTARRAADVMLQVVSDLRGVPA